MFIWHVPNVSKAMNIPFSQRNLISRSQSCAIQSSKVNAPQSNIPLGSPSLQLCQLTAEPSLHDQRSRHAAHSSSVTSPQSHGQPHEQPHTSWARRIPNHIFGSLQYIIHNNYAHIMYIIFQLYLGKINTSSQNGEILRVCFKGSGNRCHKQMS